METDREGGRKQGKKQKGSSFIPPATVHGGRHRHFPTVTTTVVNHHHRIRHRLRHHPKHHFHFSLFSHKTPNNHQDHHQGLTVTTISNLNMATYHREPPPSPRDTLRFQPTIVRHQPTTVSPPSNPQTPTLTRTLTIHQRIIANPPPTTTISGHSSSTIAVASPPPTPCHCFATHNHHALLFANHHP